MCPSSGHGGGLREQLRRVCAYCRNLEEQLHTLLVPAAALFLVVLYCFPVLSVLLLCSAAAWLYYSYPEWRLPTGGVGRRQRPAVHRRHREPTLKWTPSSLLLLMGSYLGKQEPPPRLVGRGTRELKERLSRPNLAVATPARRLSFRETPVISNRGYLSPRRRYPIRQPQYSMPGSLPTVYLDGFQKKSLLSPKYSSVRSPVTVKIARPDPNVTRSPVLDSLLSPGPVVQCAPDPCAKETVLNAIRESRKRMNKDDHGSSGGLESKRRRQASSENEDMLLNYPLPNGSVLSYVSKIDSLKRGLNSQVLEDQMNKRSRTSSVSSLISSAVNGTMVSTHNAITSSYSSSRDLQKRKRALQNKLSVSSSPSSRSHTPDLSAKKAREESHDSPSTSACSDKNYSGTSNETPSKSSAVSSSTENGSIDARRKKVLLVSGSRDQYPLPPPPLVGYSITSKDFDSEKKASLQRLNKALEDGSVPLSSGSITISTPPTSQFTLPKSPLLSLPASTVLTKPTAALDLPASSNSNPLLFSLPKIQDQESKPASAPSLNIAFKENHSVSLACPEPAKPSDNAFKLSSLSAPPATETLNGVPPAPETLGTPEPPKSSLLQTHTKPPETSTQPEFGTIFPISVAVTPPASTGLPTTVSTSKTFNPIFGNSQPQQNPIAFKTVFGNSTSQPPASTSPFTFQTNTASTLATSPFSAFGAKSTNTTLGTDTVSKPSMALQTSSSSTLASSFPSVTMSSGSAAPVNSLLGRDAPAELSAKQFVFGQVPTTQTTSGLNVFGSVQSAPSVSQPQQPLFGSNTSAFTAAVGSNPPVFPTNTSTSAFNSTQGTGVKAETSVQGSVTSFGSSGNLPAFGTGTQLSFGNAAPTFNANSQPTFGTNATFTLGNSTPASKETFGNLNSTQTNSTPAASVFGSHPFTFGETAGGASTYGTPNATPSQSLGFGNTLAPNTGIANPSTTLSFGTTGPAENKTAFAPQFGQSSPAVGTTFAPSTPSFGNAAPFGQPGAGFSIGVTPKPSGARQRVMARRQHQRKK